MAEKVKIKTNSHGSRLKNRGSSSEFYKTVEESVYNFLEAEGNICPYTHDTTTSPPPPKNNNNNQEDAAWINI